MKKKTNKIIILSITAIIFVVALLIFILNYSKDDASFSILEKKWISDNTRNVIITIDGENNVYTNVSRIETVVKQKTIKCLRNKDYNFVKKINEKFLK